MEIAKFLNQLNTSEKFRSSFTKFFVSIFCKQQLMQIMGFVDWSISSSNIETFLIMAHILQSTTSRRCKLQERNRQHFHRSVLAFFRHNDVFFINKNFNCNFIPIISRAFNLICIYTISQFSSIRS